MADHLFELLLRSPAWVGPVVALVVYLMMLGLFPAIFATAGEPLRSIFGGLSVQFAPWVALIVLAIWIIAEVKKRARRRQFDSQGDLASIRRLSWQDFEKLVAEAYRRQGYAVTEQGGSRPDGGVDLILRRDGQTTLVQCKQWNAWKVGVKVARELYGVMAAEKASRGIIVTCGRFTHEAAAFAQGKPLDLLDGDAVWRLVAEVKRGAGPQTLPPVMPARQAVPAGVATQVRPVAPAIPAEPGPASSAPMSSVPAAPVACPACGSAMVLRTARRGAQAGSSFFGCSRYPACRGIRQVE